MPQEELGVFSKVFETITIVPIDNTKFRRSVWALKIISQIVEIVLGGVVLGKDIAPNLQKIREGSTDHFEDASSYENAAIAFIVFFALEIILDMMLWIFVVLSGGQDACVIVSVLLSIFFDMPIMICGLYVMRYKGIIDWDQQFFELIFQIWFILNIVLQITAGYAKKVRYWGVFILGPLSYLIACLLYAFVIIPMTDGWHFFPLLSNYHDFIHGTFTSSHTHNMFDFLILSGFMGHWIWVIMGIIILGIFATAIAYVIFNKYWETKLSLLIIIGTILLIISYISSSTFMIVLFMLAITAFIALTFYGWCVECCCKKLCLKHDISAGH